MSVAVETVAIRYDNVSAGVPIVVNMPAFAIPDIDVYYGADSLVAAYATDYTVELAGDFNTFTVTPTASLIAKIDALIAFDPTEVNYITVRRELDYKTSSTASLTRDSRFVSGENDRTAMRFQQLAEALRRSVALPPGFVGEQQLILYPGGLDQLATYDVDGNIRPLLSPKASELASLAGVEAGRSLVYPPSPALPVYDAVNRRIGNLAPGIALTDAATVGQLTSRTVYATVLDLIASTEASRGLGATWMAQGFRYTEAASAATDFQIQTASGVKLYVAPNQLVDVMMFGAVPDGVTDSTAKFVAAAQYLLKRTDPGGTIWVRGHFKVTAAAGGSINFWDILAAAQGITPADNYLPNGKLVRGTYIALKGDGYEVSRVTVGGTGDAFVWGNFTAINDKRAMSGNAEAIDFIGPGAIGHTAQVVVDNGFGQSYTTITNALAGTTNTNTRCLVFEECVPNSFVRDCRFRYFQEAIHQTYGFGLVIDGNDIQYCNIGVFCDVGVTTCTIRDGNEIEVCAVGVFMKNTSNCFIGAAVIEANLAGCDILVWVSKYLTIDGAWNEGSPRSVVLLGDLTAPSLPNSGMTFRNMVGLNIDSNGGVKNLHVVDCAINNLVETYVVNGGERFENIVYENCTLSEGGFDLSKLSVQAGYEHHVKVVGPTINKTALNYVHREPLKRSGAKIATSAASPNTVFELSILNQNGQARIVIEGTWIPSTDYQRVTFRYVGVIRRITGTQTVVQFSTTESLVTRHTATGANIQNLPAIPSVTISGAIGTTQTATMEFALGTAVSDSATTVWEAELMSENDGIVFK